MKQQIKFKRAEAFSVIAALGRMIESLDDGEYILTVDKFRAKRSLDANAYMWLLLGKLAQTRGLPGTTELYRNYIKECGVRDFICVSDRAVDKFVGAWESNGEGWLTEVVGSKIAGCKTVICYYGSSVYDTSQMSRLIELVVQDCKAVGIETMTPRELSLLCEEWGKKNGR